MYTCRAMKDNNNGCALLLVIDPGSTLAVRILKSSRAPVPCRLQRELIVRKKFDYDT